MKEEFKFVVGFVAISVFLVALFFVFSIENKYTIINPTKNESAFLINVAGCSDAKLMNETDFLVPLEYVEAGLQFGEIINETYGKMCWYDVILAEDLNETWLNDNCEKKAVLFSKRYICDKGFIVI